MLDELWRFVDEAGRDRCEDRCRVRNPGWWLAWQQEHFEPDAHLSGLQDLDEGGCDLGAHQRAGRLVVPRSRGPTAVRRDGHRPIATLRRPGMAP
jgi:hypothetical protein